MLVCCILPDAFNLNKHKLWYMAVDYNTSFQVNWACLYSLQPTEILFHSPGHKEKLQKKTYPWEKFFSVHFVKEVQKIDVEVILRVLITYYCLLLK